ncbi:hypothetical protein MKX03_011162 [Papaver bracteatum]|nr:hypothetical protein MKX03_011162 [Papaver bracteatum]
MADVLTHCATRTFIIRGFMGPTRLWTANPENVKHFLQSHFPIYQKGELSTGILSDFLGTGIFNIDGAKWKFQRKLASDEFNTKSLCKQTTSTVREGTRKPVRQNKQEMKSMSSIEATVEKEILKEINEISYEPDYEDPKEMVYIHA